MSCASGVDQVTGRLRVPSGHQHRPGRRADRAIGHHVIQAHALAGQAVDVRCSDLVFAKNRKRLRAQLIGIDYDYIWFTHAYPLSNTQQESFYSSATSNHRLAIM